MRRWISVPTGLAFLLAGTGVAFAQITGTKHDFETATWNTTGEKCKMCHVPHTANVTIEDTPLWNHDLSVATYTVYGSSTLDATVGQPDGGSKACLGCHDGTVALNAFGGNTFTGADVFIPGTANLGSDLSDDHPVSFVYDATLATNDGELNDPTTTTSGLGGTIGQDMLFSTKVQCASCHDPHDNTNAPFLVKSNAGSALCQTCHTK